MERSAYLATAWRLGRYYRTYPAYVQDEVQAALDDPGSQFQRGPLTLTARGTATDDTAAFTVLDRNYLSARWPGDAYLFARRFCDLLAWPPWTWTRSGSSSPCATSARCGRCTPPRRTCSPAGRSP